jgi:transcription initiation factor TFIIIB Brf1 subunit/transcription initiation factor TFIIB
MRRSEPDWSEWDLSVEGASISNDGMYECTDCGCVLEARSEQREVDDETHPSEESVERAVPVVSDGPSWG